jgi:hypothetical protein
MADLKIHACDMDALQVPWLPVNLGSANALFDDNRDNANSSDMVFDTNIEFEELR